MNGQVIIIKNELFWELVDAVIETTERKLQKKLAPKKPWLTPQEAMEALNIGKTSLYKLRISGKIRYTKSKEAIKFCTVLPLLKITILQMPLILFN